MKITNLICEFIDSFTSIFKVDHITYKRNLVDEELSSTIFYLSLAIATILYVIAPVNTGFDKAYTNCLDDS